MVEVKSIKLLPAKKEDAELLARIHVDSWRAAYRNIVPDSFLEGFTYQKRTKAFYDAMENKSEETYIAKIDDMAVGILTVGENRDDDLDKSVVGEIWGIYIAPDFWRRGVGTFLVKEAEKILMDRGYKELVLWVLKENRNAREFYEKMGYFPDGKEQIIYLGKELMAIRCIKKFRKVKGAQQSH